MVTIRTLASPDGSMTDQNWNRPGDSLPRGDLGEPAGVQPAFRQPPQGNPAVAGPFARPGAVRGPGIPADPNQPQYFIPGRTNVPMGAPVNAPVNPQAPYQPGYQAPYAPVTQQQAGVSYDAYGRRCHWQSVRGPNGHNINIVVDASGVNPNYAYAAPYPARPGSNILGGLFGWTGVVLASLAFITAATRSGPGAFVTFAVLAVIASLCSAMISRAAPGGGRILAAVGFFLGITGLMIGLATHRKTYAAEPETDYGDEGSAQYETPRSSSPSGPATPDGSGRTANVEGTEEARWIIGEIERIHRDTGFYCRNEAELRRRKSDTRSYARGWFESYKWNGSITQDGAFEGEVTGVPSRIGGPTVTVTANPRQGSLKVVAVDGSVTRTTTTPWPTNGTAGLPPSAAKGNTPGKQRSRSVPRRDEAESSY